MTTLDDSTTTTSPGPSPRSLHFRGDIDGLRAVAIVVVVGYHAGIPGFSGGFVGVDVFFVVSGFLITRILLRESEDRGRIRLISFWGKRIRRLVPALSLMLVVTLALSWLVLAPREIRSAANSAAYAALYLSNVLFARAGTDYFAADLDADPYLHTWSLGVEEQFYVVWPLLLVAAIVGSRFLRGSKRNYAIGIFAATVVTSLALSISLTDRGEPWAFFGLPTRMWEFAAAGLLAALPLSRRLPSAAWRAVGSVVGLGLIVWATTALSDSDPYPGSLALVPVIGTLLVIAAGTTTADQAPNPVSRPLSTRPLQWLGRVSYSWYLWHWPLMILAVAYLEEDSAPIRTAAAAAALGVAYAAYRFVENPIRFNRHLVGSNRRTYIMGLTGTVLVALLVSASTLHADRLLDQSPHRDLATELDAFNAFKSGTCGDDDAEELCVFGDPDGARTVLLIGDSHARQWVAAMSEAASALGVRLIVRWSSGCPASEIAIDQERGGLCERYRRRTEEIIGEATPDAVVISQSSVYPAQTPGAANVLDENGRTASRAEAPRLWARALEDLLRSVGDGGAGVGFIIDNPTLESDPATCIGRKGSAARCTPSREAALSHNEAARAAELEVLDRTPGVATFSVNETICQGETCALEHEDTFVFVDSHHLTQSFTLLQVPRLERFLEEVLAG